MPNTKNISTALLLVLFLTFFSSCTAWFQDPKKYRITDDGETSHYQYSEFKREHPDLIDLPIYAALSKSIYLDTNNSKHPKVKTLNSFCKEGQEFQALYRPDRSDEWNLIELKSINNKKSYHKDLGLEIEVFKKKFRAENFVVLFVFRGTDFEEKEDWTSNLRWFLRFFSRKGDQYDEVKNLIPSILEELEKEHGPIESYSSTGHSLGGGLAQLAGYTSPLISTVYAFDSSPVTGFYDFNANERKTNAEGMKIYRIYEHGEILAYFRLIMKLLYPISKENPDIVQVRFNLLDKNIVTQHGIHKLGCELRKNIN